jgi:hypothetical protein
MSWTNLPTSAFCNRKKFSTFFSLSFCLGKKLIFFLMVKKNTGYTLYDSISDYLLVMLSTKKSVFFIKLSQNPFLWTRLTSCSSSCIKFWAVKTFLIQNCKNDAAIFSPLKCSWQHGENAHINQGCGTASFCAAPALAPAATWHCTVYQIVYSFGYAL